jgi:hypothetical protein
VPQRIVLLKWKPGISEEQVQGALEQADGLTLLDNHQHKGGHHYRVTMAGPPFLQLEALALVALGTPRPAESEAFLVRHAKHAPELGGF